MAYIRKQHRGVVPINGNKITKITHLLCRSLGLAIVNSLAWTFSLLLEAVAAEGCWPAGEPGVAGAASVRTPVRQPCVKRKGERRGLEQESAS